MKIKNICGYSLTFFIGLLLFACVDSAYDLTEIDSTVGLKVNNLVLPLKIDAITLKNILNIEDDSQIKVINGEYAFLEEGNFQSEQIQVPSFKIPAPQIDPIKETIELVSYDFSNLPVSIPDDLFLIGAEIHEATTSFNFEAKNIDPALVKIDEIGANFIVRLIFSFSRLSSFLNSIEIENLAIKLPKGLETTVSDQGSYDPITGILTFKNTLLSDANLQKEITLSVSKIDAEKAGIELVDGVLSLETTSVLSGKFAIYGRNLKKPIDVTELSNLKKLTYQLEINFPNGDIEVTDFTGDVRYQFDGINVSPVNIDNLPSLLNQEGTDIRIANPQIYVSISNPLYKDYQIYANAGIELIPTPKSDLTFKTNLTFDKTINQFCLSPTQPEKMYITGSTYLEFNNLGNILSGDKLPDKIDIEIVHPEVPQQKVRNFQLGQSLGAVQGSYVFYAPLAMTAEAQIHYSDTLDGWSSNELDNFIVNQLSIEANIQSDIPFGFKAIAYPINKNANKLTKNGKPIEALLRSVGTDGTTKDILPALANTTVLIEMEGPLKEIDGIIVKATLSGAEGNHSLKPNQNIQLTDIQLKVSGEYINEF